MHVTMIGAGYVGLVSGACFSDFGHEVICVDRDVGKIEQLQTGNLPIYHDEPWGPQAEKEGFQPAGWPGGWPRK